jgi:hypothetical protein
MMMLQRQREAEQMTLEKPKEEGQPTPGAPNTANQQPGLSDQLQPPSGPTDEAAASGAPQSEAKAEADGEEGDEEYDDEAGEGEGEEGEEGEEEGEEEAEAEEEGEEGGEENGQEEANGTNDAAEAEATSAATGKAKEAKPEESAAVAASLDEIRFRVKTVCKKAKKAADNRYAIDAIDPIG